MRVSTKALAPLSSLLLLASCAATAAPPPVAIHAPRPLAASSPAAVPASLPASYSAAQQGNYDRPAPPHVEGSYSQPKTGRLAFHFGRRELDEAFAPAEDPFAFAMEFSNVPTHGGIGFEFGFQFGYDEAENQNLPLIGNADLETSQGELYAGLRAELTDGPVRPYVGFGGTWIRTDTSIEVGNLVSEEDDSDFGWYGHAGIQADLSEGFFIGFDYRRVFDTEYTIDSVDFDGDYEQIAFTLGMSF